MALSIAQRIQKVTPDSIAYAGDMELAVRANGEEVTSIIDLAGNFYPAGIPQPTFTPTLNATAAIANTLEAGFYAYRYVYAATKRYPLVDAGIGIGGNISPRGNPSATLVVESPAPGPNRVTINVQYNDRLDVTEIWVFRSVKYTTAADAQIAGDAGLVFFMGEVVNVPSLNFTTYIDNSKDIATSAQVELDNFFAPTFKYVRYIPPYFWGIGNDDLIVKVKWANNVITVDELDPSGFVGEPRVKGVIAHKWFTGRNGQLATVTGIVTGGIDDKGKFFFKAGDLDGNNLNFNAILTVDGTTPSVLSPATGSGYLKITGPGATLFRSKPRNPFAWGFTQIFGASRIAQTYGILVGSGKATGIIALPGDELLKIDLKNPNVCYVFNLKIAAFPEFSTTRKAISKNSVSSHLSQFYANTGKNQKVVWGWDSDTFAILQCDGNSQVPVTDALFKTFRTIDPEPSRVRRVHGVCDEENQLNVVWLPVRGQTPGDEIILEHQVVLSPLITDLMIAHHFPSGKWSISYDFDMTCSAVVRDQRTNTTKVLGGFQSGIVGHILDPNKDYNFAQFGQGVPARTIITHDAANASFTLPVGSFVIDGMTDEEITIAFVGLWGALFRYDLPWVTFVRIQYLHIPTNTLGYDISFTDYFPSEYFGFLFQDLIGDAEFAFTPEQYTFILGDISGFLKKKLSFKAPSTNKGLRKMYLGGKNLDTSLVFLFNHDDNGDPFSAIRAPSNVGNKSDHLQKLIANTSNNVWEVQNIAVPAGKEVILGIHTNTRSADVELKNIILKLHDTRSRG